MPSIRTALVTALAVGLTIAAVPAPAGAQQGSDPHARAVFLGKIERLGSKATLKVRYRCATGQALWVSAKQVASRRRDPALK
jgi:hypothetical protein